MKTEFIASLAVLLIGVGWARAVGDPPGFPPTAAGPPAALPGNAPPSPPPAAAAATASGVNASGVRLRGAGRVPRVGRFVPQWQPQLRLSFGRTLCRRAVA